MGDAEEEAPPGGSDRPSVDTLTATPAELEVYAGEYHSDVLDVTYVVRLGNDGLLLEVGNALDGPMALVGEDAFRRGPLRIRFTRNRNGEVVGFELDAGRVRGIGFELEARTKSSA